MTPLVLSVARFADAYHAKVGLADSQRGWTCTLALVASDAVDRVFVRIDDGRISSFASGDESADVVITSDLATLCDVLEMRRSPNEPYLFGDLTVVGPETHFVRLDWLASELCEP
jgi:hypothetical protein